MAKLSRIELLKQKLADEKARKEGAGSPFNNDIYPFWTMDVGQQARVRILPDLNEDNEYIFFKDRLEHTLSINGEDRKIPCRQMYNEECPICDLSRKWYKEEGRGSKNGKYYYRKKISLVRVLVLDDPLPPNKDTGETYEGKVMNTQFGFQLMEKIKEQISNDDLGEFYDLDEGFDFIIKKTPQGDYGTYSVGSQFARKSTSIDEDMREGIELVDFGTLLPKDFGYDKVHAMLEAHLSGEDYDEDGDSDSEEKETPKSDKKPSPKKSVKEEVEEEEVEEAEEEDTPPPAPKNKVAKAAKASEDEGSDDGDDDSDILAKLRERRRKAAASRK